MAIAEAEPAPRTAPADEADESLTASRMIKMENNEKYDDDDIDLPPLDDDGGDGGRRVCDWPFELCYEQGTCQLSTGIDVSNGSPEYHYLCLKHFTVFLERIADELGESTSNMIFYIPQALEDHVLSRVLDWVAPAVDGASIPPDLLHAHLNRTVKINETRLEEDDEHPEEPRHAGWTAPVVDAARRKVESYLQESGRTLAASPDYDKRPRKHAKKLTNAELRTIITDVFEPIVADSYTVGDAVERLNQLDLAQAIAEL